MAFSKLINDVLNDIRDFDRKLTEQNKRDIETLRKLHSKAIELSKQPRQFKHPSKLINR